jgi:hypothetical protein
MLCMKSIMYEEFGDLSNWLTFDKVISEIKIG